MTNRYPIALTVDMEDTHHGIRVAARGSSLSDEVEWLLDCFGRHRVRATFFVLGELLESHADLVVAVADRGHEIGFHGGHHDFLQSTGPAAFRTTLSSYVPQLRALVQQDVTGFRAPFFSLTPGTEWCLEALGEAGFSYDASIYPGPNDRYGWPGAPRTPVRHAASGLTVFPVPLMHSWLPIAFSGGVYLRTLPWLAIRWAFRRQQRRGEPGMVYLHPWEIAEQLSWRRDARLRANVTRHLCRTRMRSRLEKILVEKRNQLMPMVEVISALPSPSAWHPGQRVEIDPPYSTPA